MKEIYPAALHKRVVALLIDLGILYILGFILTLVFDELILVLGNFKILIGVIFSTLYFTLFHSSIGKGQTLGKRIFNYKVVKLNGDYLNTSEAFLRSIVFTLPYCFSDLLSVNTLNSIGFFDFMRFTIIPASLFINHIFVFLNPLNQCYYDAWLNSVVIGPDSEPATYKLYKKWMTFIPHIALALIVSIGLIVLNPFSEENRTDLNQLSEIKSAITAERYLHFSKLYFTYPQNDPYQKTLKIDCYMTGDEDISSEVYLITEELAPLKDKFNIKKITLSVVRDFNLGMYSSWEVLKKNEKAMKFDL
jgi:uncharacterized RDD family membrane protein YckC